jgi:hypothetical protein
LANLASRYRRFVSTTVWIPPPICVLEGGLNVFADAPLPARRERQTTTGVYVFAVTHLGAPNALAVPAEDPVLV